MFGKKKKAKVTQSVVPLPLLPPPIPLEEELRNIWNYPLTRTPVFKDLPRLAQRIVVLGSLKTGPVDVSMKLPKKEGSNTPTSTHVKSPTPASSANTPIHSNATGSNVTGTSSGAASPLSSNHSSAPSTPTPSHGSPTPPVMGSPVITAHTSVTSTIKPSDDVPSRSYKVYLNTTEINVSRAAQWPATYDIRALNVFQTEKKVFLEFLAENEESVVCRAEASQLIAVEDSSRYFVIMQAHHETVPKIIRNTGFAFYTRDEAADFLKFTKEQGSIEVPIVPATEFANVDVRHKELKIVPLLNVEPEGYIEEDSVTEIAAFTNQMLAEIGSSKSHPDQLHKLRDSITIRLSKQGLGVIVTKEEKRLSSRLLTAGSLTAKSSKNLPILVAIRRVVNAIAEEMETPDLAAKIAADLGRPENETYEGDMEILVEQLFTVIGHDTKTAKVFKAVTQAIIHTATYQIKSTIQTNIMTGDVRGPEGWQIVVLFAHDVINITHRRREKSLDSLGPKHQFWFEWVLHMVFDKKMGDLASANLRISDIGYGDGIDPAIKETIAATFCNGDLLIA